MSPLNYFREDNGYELKSGDYVKTYGYYKARAAQYVRNTDSNSDMENQGWVWIAREFEDVVYPLPAIGFESLKIEEGHYLEDGEHIPDKDGKLSESHIGNGFLNTSYGKVSGTSQTDAPLGIGNDTYYMTFRSSGQGNHVAGSAQEWNFNLQVGAVEYNDPDGASLTTAQIFRLKEVAYIRPLQKQYGGANYEDRSKQKYISTNHYQPVTKDIPNVIQVQVYGGDTYVNYFAKEFIHHYNSEEVQNPGHLAPPEVDRRMSVAYMMPTESYINTALALGRYFDKDRDGEDTAAYVTDVYSTVPVYTQQNNSEGKSFAEDFASKTTEEFPHRLWASDKKFDGEFIDNWRIFKDNNYIEVEGTYGPINKVVNFQDKLLFYQNRGFGVGSINERSMITDTSGVEVAVGTGSILDHFRYISTETGSFHQFGVVKSNNNIYHYDTYLNKIYKLAGNGAVPLGDVEGMSSFFHKNVKHAIINTDRTLRNQSGVLRPVGIHGVYDYRYNRVLFTFLFSDPDPEVKDFTIGFNEYLDSFESFYSFTPSLYLEAGRRVLSAENPGPLLGSFSKAYLHNVGERGVFYDKDPAPSYITLLISPAADIPKLFNNLEYNSEIFSKDIDGEYTSNERDETVTSLEYYTDYQASGVIPVTVPTNVKRRMRHWRHALIRDQNSNTQESRHRKARFRDYHIFLKLSYDNANDRRLVLHDVITSYVIARD